MRYRILFITLLAACICAALAPHPAVASPPPTPLLPQAFLAPAPRG